MTLELAILSVAVLIAGRVASVAWFARSEIARGQRRRGDDRDEVARVLASPLLSVVIPAFNEEKTIVHTVRSVLESDYDGPLEIVVVNDGSLDGTLEILRREFRLEATVCRSAGVCPHTVPKHFYSANVENTRLVVIDKSNGGKGDALNAGLSQCSGAYVCVIDADTTLERNALATLWAAIAADPTVVAAGGVIGIANNRAIGIRNLFTALWLRRLLCKLQEIEYARAFTVNRLAADRLGLITLISGAFGIFRHDVLISVGGYRRDTVGEDYELVVRIHRFMIESNRPYRIRFVPHAGAWTEAPDTLIGLITQRSRWQRGALQTLFRHHDMIWNRRYGRVGAIGIGSIPVRDLVAPIGYFAVVLGVLACCVVGLLTWTFVVIIACLALFIRWIANIHAAYTFASLLGLKSKREVRVWLLLGLSLIDAVLYRHLIGVFRLFGVLQQIRRRPSPWGSIERRGVACPAACQLHLAATHLLGQRDCPGPHVDSELGSRKVST